MSKNFLWFFRLVTLVTFCFLTVYTAWGSEQKRVVEEKLKVWKTEKIEVRKNFPQYKKHF